MDVPEHPRDWQYETVVAVLTEHEFEPGRFDYKAALTPSKGDEKWKVEHTKSVRHTACSMANGEGGYILFGVQDRKVQVAHQLDRIVGISVNDDLRRVFGDKIVKIERAVPFEDYPIRLPSDETQCVYVVWIPKSNLRPHIDSTDGRFLVRTPGGTASPMGYIQVRDQMLYTEGRLQKVTLLRLELAAMYESLKRLTDPISRFIRYDTAAFKVLLADVADLLQQDSGLLTLLHEAATGMEMLNQILAEVEKLTPPASQFELGDPFKNNQWRELTREQQKRQPELQNKCADAQTRLTALFGPLPV